MKYNHLIIDNDINCEYVAFFLSDKVPYQCMPPDIVWLRHVIVQQCDTRDDFCDDGCCEVCGTCCIYMNYNEQAYMKIEQQYKINIEYDLRTPRDVIDKSKTYADDYNKAVICAIESFFIVRQWKRRATNEETRNIVESELLYEKGDGCEKSKIEQNEWDNDDVEYKLYCIHCVPHTCNTVD